jgi:hypothetical protein
MITKIIKTAIVLAVLAGLDILGYHFNSYTANPSIIVLERVRINLALIFEELKLC